MDSADKKWARPFRSRDSKICCISRMNWWMNWADFLHADTNLWKLKVTLIIIGWVWSKLGEVLKIMGLLNQAYLTNDLMNWADWLNDFDMLIVMEYYFFALNDALYWLYENCSLGKICFLSYRPKCSSQIRLQDFLNFNISKTIWGIMFFFCM